MTGTRSIGRFEYRKPGPLSETLRILNNKGADARILAGGTDLILQIKEEQKKGNEREDLS